MHAWADKKRSAKAALENGDTRKAVRREMKTRRLEPAARHEAGLPEDPILVAIAALTQEVRQGHQEMRQGRLEMQQGRLEMQQKDNRKGEVHVPALVPRRVIAINGPNAGQVGSMSGERERERSDGRVLAFFLFKHVLFGDSHFSP